MVSYSLFFKSWPACCNTFCFRYKFAWHFFDYFRKSCLSPQVYLGRTAGLAWVVLVDDCQTSHIWPCTDFIRGILIFACRLNPYDRTYCSLGLLGRQFCAALIVSRLLWFKTPFSMKRSSSWAYRLFLQIFFMLFSRVTRNVLVNCEAKTDPMSETIVLGE